MLKLTKSLIEVFELLYWMVNNDDSITRGTTWEGWMKFICGDGWAPSAMMIDGKFIGGVEAMSKE